MPASPPTTLARPFARPSNRVSTLRLPLPYASSLPTGQNYVYMHMSAVIGSAALFLNWEHEVTPLSEEIEIIATLFPKVRLARTLSRLIDRRMYG